MNNVKLNENWKKFVLNLNRPRNILILLSSFFILHSVVRALFCWWNGYTCGYPPIENDKTISFWQLKHMFKHMPLDTGNNMDFVGYLLAVITFIIGMRISYALDLKGEEKDSEVQAVLSRIHNAAENLEDVTRSVVDTFPKLFDHIEKMLLEAKINKGTVKIMNRTSSFGRIHSYNWKTVREFLPNHLALEYSDENFKQGVRCFVDQIEKIEHLAKECTKLNDIRYLFFHEQSLVTKFINEYLDNQKLNEKEPNPDIIYYEERGDEIHINKALSNQDKREKITQKVVSKHNKAYKDYVRERKEKSLDEDVILLTNDSNHIPMQIYLTKFKTEAHSKRASFRTLVIFAVDEVENGIVKRSLIGISSSLKRMYDVFDTFFNEPFK